jgi:hypothetical protein
VSAPLEPVISVTLFLIKKKKDLVSPLVGLTKGFLPFVILKSSLRGIKKRREEQKDGRGGWRSSAQTVGAFLIFPAMWRVRDLGVGSPTVQ